MCKTVFVTVSCLQVSSEQAAVEKVMAGVQAELAKVDTAIQTLEQQLYEAHHNLVSIPRHMHQRNYKFIGCDEWI